MYTDFTTITWEEAYKSFLIHLKAIRAPKTVYFYDVQLRMLVRFVNEKNLPLNRFTKRNLDEYLVHRKDNGIALSTLHHDALCAKVFFKWCQKNDLVERSPLADYEIRTAPKTHKYMPTQEDIKKLLESVLDFWNPEQNPDARYSSLMKRSFHRDRDYGIVVTLLDSACRIGEVLSLKVGDYIASNGQSQITIRESKGREPRYIPVSRECEQSIATWMKVRNRIMKNVPKEEDEGWLFMSETGTKIDEGRFLKTLKKFTNYAELSKEITLHSLRRYSLNRLAKHNLLMAQTIAGHKDTKTTLIYTKIDPEFVRQMHDQVGVVRGVLQSKRSVKRKRLIG